MEVKKSRQTFPVKTRAFPNIEPDNYRRKEWEMAELEEKLPPEKEKAPSKEPGLDILSWYIRELDFDGETERREFFESDSEVHARISELKKACAVLSFSLVFEHAHYALGTPTKVGKSH